MSIWVSRKPIGFDPYPDDEPQPQGGQVRSYATGWSNHYPTVDGQVEREAFIDTAHIPEWCVPGNDETDGTYETVGPWLRLSVYSHEHDYLAPRNVVAEAEADVVLDESAVRALVADLTEWLNRPKAHPR